MVDRLYWELDINCARTNNAIEFAYSFIKSIDAKGISKKKGSEF